MILRTIRMGADRRRTALKTPQIVGTLGLALHAWSTARQSAALKQAGGSRGAGARQPWSTLRLAAGEGTHGCG